MIRDLVQAVDSLSGGGNPNVVGKRDGLLHLRKSGWAIVGLASNVCRVAQVDDGGASGDDDGVVGKSGGKGKRDSGSLIGVHVSVALLPCILFGLASGGVLATICLLLLLASLLLLRQPVPPLLLLLELGVPRVVLDCANLVHVVVRLLLP